MYAGQLTGEANFRKTESTREGVGGFLRWIAGIIVGEQTPVVLQRPQSGVVDESGRIYVTDSSRQALFVFEQKAGDLWVWDKAEGLSAFISPVAVTLGPGGQVLVSDAELGIVARLDAKGNPQRSFGKGVLKRPTGLAYDAKRGLIYVADTRAHDIKVFDHEGRVVNTLGRHGEGDGEFNAPTFLTFAHDALYVVDAMNNRVQVFRGDNTQLRLKFGTRGLYVGNLVRPKGVAVDSEGNIYVVESYYDRLLVFDKHGKFLMPIGGTGQETGRFYLPAGVWVDSHNRVFVADMFNGRVVLFQFLGGGADGEP
jgi:DNA-binding beta-propeller fold protein YncE